MQPHVRPWSTVTRFELADGPAWFKVNGPGTAYEPGLLGVLSRLVPDLVPQVLATDTSRGWSLTRDAGPTLRLAAPPEEQWPHWEQIMARYAEAQLLLAGHATSLVDAGVTEVSPGTLPGQTEALVADLAAVSPDEGGLSSRQVGELKRVLPELGAWCAELAASGVPISIQHDDLHSNNVCWAGSSADATRIIDWGDASLGHPFGTLLVTLNTLAAFAECPDDDARVLRVRDAYLEPFGSLADRSTLVRYVELARRTGCVARALSWGAALQGEPASVHAQWEFPVRGWLLEVLEAG